MKHSNLLMIVFILLTVTFTSCSSDDDSSSCPVGTIELPSSNVRTYNGRFAGLSIENSVADGTATITRTDCGLYTLSFSIEEIAPYTDISFISNSEGTTFTNAALFPVITINDEGLTVSDISPIFTFNTEE